MKGLPKPILNPIIEHATPDDFGQFLLMSRHVGKTFSKVVKDLKRDTINARYTGSLDCVKYQTRSLCIKTVNKFRSELKNVKDKRIHAFFDLQIKTREGFKLAFLICAFIFLIFLRINERAS
jgi:hypothetical protein